MTNALPQDVESVWAKPQFKRKLKRRRAAEIRFKFYGIGALMLGVFFVVVLFVSITINGVGAFWQTQVQLEIQFDPDFLDPENLAKANYGKLIKQSLYRQFPEVTKRKEKRQLGRIVSVGADVILQKMVQNDPSLIGTTQTIWLPVDDEFDMLHKNNIGRDTGTHGGGRLSRSAGRVV